MLVNKILSKGILIGMLVNKILSKGIPIGMLVNNIFSKGIPIGRSINLCGKAAISGEVGTKKSPFR